MTPFDRARSPWEAVLSRGCPTAAPPTSSSCTTRSPTAMGGVQLLSLLHSPQAGAATRQAAARPAGARARTPLSRARRAARAATRVGAAGLRRRRRAAPLRARSPTRTRPRRGAALRPLAAARARRAAGRAVTAAAPRAACRGASARSTSPFADLSARRQGRRRLAQRRLPRALLGGFRRYHESSAQPVEDDADGDADQRARGGRPAGRQPLRRRALRRARRRSTTPPSGSQRDRRARARPRAPSRRSTRSALLAPALARLPGAARHASSPAADDAATTFRRATCRASATTSTWPGRAIERMFPFGPLPGCAVMITLVSHGGPAASGSTSTRPRSPSRALRRCLQEGFDEVLALHPGPGADRLDGPEI